MDTLLRVGRVLGVSLVSRVALGLSLLVAGCAAVKLDTRCESSGVVRRPASYVWFEDAPAVAQSDSAAAAESVGANAAPRLELDDAGLLEEVRLCADEQLAARGLSRTTSVSAEYIAVPKLWVELRDERLDPLFSAANALRFEVGGVELALFDARTGQRVWCGGASTRLRDVAVGFGVKLVRYAPTKEERRWRIPAKVRALFEGLRPAQN